MKRQLLVLVTTALGALGGCGAGDQGLSTRIDRLEKEVAALKAAQGERRIAQRSPGGCRDATIPEGTSFPHHVDFEVGRTDVVSGDRIVITEILGSRATFEKGGVYLVRGEYTLSSADDAMLAFYVTATRREDACSTGNPRGHRNIRRGSGTFELAHPILTEGYPHVTFYVQGSSAGGVYFGKGAFLQR